jgi:hypothetical protein
MLWGRAYAFSVLTAVSFLALPAAGQSVISTHSGVVHFFEGAVYVGDQPLESHPGKFPSVPQGAELRTMEGRAEVLLTPGVFIRVGPRSTIRMVANQLSDTRVELLAGSAIVDSAEPSPGTSVTLLFKNWSVHSSEQGSYRIDSDPPRLWVFQGRAEVSSGKKEDAQLVGPGMNLPFAQVLVPDQSGGRPHDALSQWSEGRQQSIFADNTIAANIQDPATLSLSNSGVDSFTYFPMLGLPSVGPASAALYNSVGTYQPGFSSVYLPGYTFFPGYTYLPLPLGLISGGYSTPSHLPRYGSLPVSPSHFPVGSPIPGRPISPYPRPVSPVSPHPGPVSPVSPHPIPVHPTSPAGAHPVIHH